MTKNKGSLEDSNRLTPFWRSLSAAVNAGPPSVLVIVWASGHKIDAVVAASLLCVVSASLRGWLGTRPSNAPTTSDASTVN